jgi:putative endonuclease
LSTDSQELGKWGEELAAEFLVDQGYMIIARNVRTPYGELDLIAQFSPEHNPNDITTIFIEVKTRSSRSYGYPEESITASKREHLISAARHYLQEHPEFDRDWRLDVIAIERYRDKKPSIRHFENALQE